MDEINIFLERINQLHKDIMVPNRIKFEDDVWYKKDKKTSEWVEMVIYSGGQVGITHSKSTGLSVSHLKFLWNHPGPYTIEQLIDFMYRGVLHRYYGWVSGFWDEEILLKYYQKLKENNEDLYEVYIRDNHTAFYKAIRSHYKKDKAYRYFLECMNEDPDVISGLSRITKSLQEGRYIETKSIDILKSLHAPFDYLKPFSDGSVPDLYHKETHSVIDIKRSINTEIEKESGKYSDLFQKVTVIYLLGSREKVSSKGKTEKMSIYKWLDQQPFFIELEDEKQSEVYVKFDQIVKRIDEKQYQSDVKDYHNRLVKKIINFDKQGFDNYQIADKVSVSYQYVNSILLGKSLKEYSGDYPELYRKRQDNNRQAKKDKKEKVIELYYEGKSVKETASQLDISTDMVKHRLAKEDLNEKEQIRIRNKRIHDELKTYTEHETLNDKFHAVREILFGRYPTISVTIIKGYYYNQFILLEPNTTIIKGTEDMKPKVISMFGDGYKREDIARELHLPIQSVRSHLRKENLGRDNILLERNKKIHQLLGEKVKSLSVKKLCEWVLNELITDYPDLNFTKVRTYYYIHFKKA